LRPGRADEDGTTVISYWTLVASAAGSRPAGLVRSSW
jgi:hypothetical protein